VCTGLYANVSTDTLHQPFSSKSTCCLCCDAISEFQVFRALDHLRHTTAGLDGIPAWFLRIRASLFSRQLTRLCNLSLTSAVVPLQWNAAFINHPSCRCLRLQTNLNHSDLIRNHKNDSPIYIYPVFHCPPFNPDLTDPFAFRPTRSTTDTAALIALLHTITSMLTNSRCLHVIVVDFSKAFDTVRQRSQVVNLISSRWSI